MNTVIPLVLKMLRLITSNNTQNNMHGLKGKLHRNKKEKTNNNECGTLDICNCHSLIQCHDGGFFCINWPRRLWCSMGTMSAVLHWYGFTCV